MQRPGWQPRCVPGDLTHGLGAQLNQPRIERPRLDAPDVAPFHRHVVLARGAPGNVARVRQHAREHGGVERPLVERDFADARHRGHDPWLRLDHANRAHHPGAGLRMPARDLAAVESGLGRGQKRVLPHGDRRRSGVRRLPDEPQHVTLDAEGAEDDAGGLVHRFKDRPLLDVELDVRFRVDPPQFPMRIEHAIQIDTVLAQRVDQAGSLLVHETAHVIDPQAPAGR